LLDFLYELYYDARIHESQIWIRTQGVLLHPQDEGSVFLRNTGT